LRSHLRKTKSHRTPGFLAQRLFYEIFTDVDCRQKLASPLPRPPAFAENPCPACVLREIAMFNCTKSGHPPVDALHSIENKSDKGRHFSLTAKLEGVQQ
jgi:hypothetical protein